MEFVEGVPLLDAPLDYETRRDAARVVFRRLVLIRCLPDLPGSIFYADPHAGISWCKRRNMPRSRSCLWTGVRRTGCLRTVRDRAATGSAGPSSAAQPSPPAQILPDAGRNYAPAGNPRVGLRSVRRRSRRANLEHSIPVARPARFYRSGLPTRTLAAHFAGAIRSVVHTHKTC